MPMYPPNLAEEGGADEEIFEEEIEDEKELDKRKKKRRKKTKNTTTMPLGGDSGRMKAMNLSFMTNFMELSGEGQRTTKKQEDSESKEGLRDKRPSPHAHPPQMGHHYYSPPKLKEPEQQQNQVEAPPAFSYSYGRPPSPPQSGWQQHNSKESKEEKRVTRDPQKHVATGEL